MTLKEYYQSLGESRSPRKDFRDKVISQCGISTITIFRWLSGEVIPDKLKRERISEITGIPEEELFPGAQA